MAVASSFFVPLVPPGTVHNSDTVGEILIPLSRSYDDTPPTTPPTGVPTLGQVWPRGNLSISMGGGGGSVAPAARQTTAITTASLANNAQATGTVTLSKSYRLLKLETNVAARIRLYSTVAKRDADLTRPAGTDPTGDHGLMLDYAFAQVMLDGPPQSVYTTQNRTDESATTNSLGSDITFGVPGRITGLRYNRTISSAVSAVTMRVWSGSTQVGSATTSGDTGSGWKTALLATPIEVLATETRRVSIDVTNFAFNYIQLAGPIVNMDLTMSNNPQYGTVGSYPNGTASYHGMVDVIFIPRVAAPLEADLSPTVDGFDGKATPDGLIPYTITNLSGSSAAVTATLTWISTE